MTQAPSFLSAIPSLLIVILSLSLVILSEAKNLLLRALRINSAKDLLVPLRAGSTRDRLVFKIRENLRNLRTAFDPGSWLLTPNTWHLTPNTCPLAPSGHSYSTFVPLTVWDRHGKLVLSRNRL